MLVSITVDTSNPEVELKAIADELVLAVTQWLENYKGEAKLVASLPEDKELASNEDFHLGLILKIKKPFHMKDPLNFLHGLAKQHKIEFAVATLEDEQTDGEAVCYFGHEEGRPDMYEIACYIDL